MLYTNYYISSCLFHGSFSYIMGTQLDVLLVEPDKSMAEETWQEIVNEVKRLEKMLSRFDAASEVSYINRNAALAPISVSEELWEILQDCRQYFNFTAGYFDITLAGFNQVALREEDKSVTFTSPALYIDLGGYGKGYALLKIQQIINRRGIKKAFVNFGNSSVLGVGTHPHGSYWPVGIENPFTKQLVATVQLCNNSLSTSGNTPMHLQHIKNPFTGKYVEGRKMVSIVAPNPVDAEVLTTALMIAEDKEVSELMKHFDINEKHIYIL